MLSLTDYSKLKPAPGSPLDAGDPITRGMFCCYAFNERGGRTVYDLCRRAGNLTFTGTTAGTDPLWSAHGLIVGKGGRGYARNNKTVKSSYNPVAADTTVRILHLPRTWPGGFTALLDVFGSSGGSNRLMSLFFDTSGNASYNGIGGTDPAPGTNSIAMAAGQVSDFVFTREVKLVSGDQTRRWYKNGVLNFSVIGPTGTAGELWPTDGYDFAAGGNPSGGGSLYDGQYLLIQWWSRRLHAAEIQELYQNPYRGIASQPTLFPGIVVVDATGTAAAPPSITLSSATLSASTPDQGPTADPPDVTLSSPAASGIDSTDAAGTADPPDITLSDPAASAGQSQSPTADPSDITLTAPFVIITNTGFAMPGTVLLSGPDCRARPNYVYSPRPSYRGRFLRGDVLPVTLTFTELPTSAPTARVFRGATLVESVRIPVVDAARRVFGLDHFLGDGYPDGNYTILYLYDVDGNTQYSVETFDVLGGEGRPPVVAVVEQKRPLGRAVLYFDDEGVGRIGYNAKVETP